MEPGFSKISTQHVGSGTSTSMPPPPPMSATPVISASGPPPVPNEVVVPVPASPKHWRVQVLETSSMIPFGAVLAETTIPPLEDKSILQAYKLSVPLGILGLHHVYLGRLGFFFVYLFTCGLLGIGWVIDLLRMPYLVNRVNKENREKYEELIKLQQDIRQQQQQHQHQRLAFVSVGQKSLDDAYILWFPLGLLGFHHFYLRNFGWGFLYLFTFGLLGIGWIIDGFRISRLVEDANENIRIRSMAIATSSSSLVRHTTSTGGNIVPPEGNANYGYQSSSPMGNNVVSYPAPAPEFQGCTYQAGFPNPSHTAVADVMLPPPPYTPNQNMASGDIAGYPPPPYKASKEDMAGGEN